MAKLMLNTALNEVRGAIDGWVYKKYADRLIVTRKPKFKPGGWSVLQDDGRDRFRMASVWANATWADPEARAFYRQIATARKAWRAFPLVTGDYLNPPEIQKIDTSGYAGRAGHVIRVRAIDDIGVVRVELRLRDRTGATVEAGAAALHAEETWHYSASTNFPPGADIEIEVVAMDRPGNRTIQWRSVTVPA